MAGAELEIDRCRCGGSGSVWHAVGSPRLAYVECAICGTRGPDVRFGRELTDDSVEFLAVARWNRLMYRG